MPELPAGPVQVLLEPLLFPFMQRALAATLIVALTCAVVGVFVVTRGLAFVGDALAHASFAGVALALLLRRNFYLGAGAAAMLTSLLIGLVSRRGRIGADLASGVLFAGAFALGIVLISPSRNYTVDLFAIVFGNVLGIGPEDLLVIAVIGLFVVVVVSLLYRPLLLAGFDPVGAEADGLPVGWLQKLVLALIGATVVAAVKALGVVLVIAMLVTPAASALMLARGFGAALLIAAGLGMGAAVIGLYVSFYANVASGASTVLVSTALFLAVALIPRTERPRSSGSQR